MNKLILGAIITVLAVGGILTVVFLNGRDSKSGSTAQVTETSETRHEDGQTDEDHNAGSTSNQANEQNASSEVLQGDVSMDIKDYAFAKKSIKVKKGTTVTWTNQDTARHDVMPDNPADSFKASELLAKGESYSFTFNTTGKFTYYCSPHPYMKGAIEVVE